MNSPRVRAYDKLVGRTITTFLGFHQFATTEDGPVVKCGSFEVFHHTKQDVEAFGEPDEPGFYWWACYPGCLPDGEPSGPFPTAEGAYLDARGD